MNGPSAPCRRPSMAQLLARRISVHTLPVNEQSDSTNANVLNEDSAQALRLHIRT